jgi:hypothetical protein
MQQPAARPGLRQKFAENREKKRKFAHFSASPGFHIIILSRYFNTLQ